MKKILVSLFVLGIFSVGVQAEAQARHHGDNDRHGYHNHHKQYKKVRHHRKYKRHRARKIVYVQPRPYYAPVRHVSYYDDYYSPFFSLGYSNAGYHIQVGFD